MILNFIEECEKKEIPISRYNGGWLKKIEGLDKSYNDGYSLRGEFVKAGDYKQNYEEGIYLDCSKEGSRKNQEWNYHLLRFTEKKGIELIQELQDGGREYAVEFWEEIEANLKKEDTVEEIVNDIFEKVGSKKTLLKVHDKLKERLGIHEDSEKSYNENNMKTTKTTIQVSMDTKRKLQELKFTENDSYDEVIVRLILLHGKEMKNALDIE